MIRSLKINGLETSSSLDDEWAKFLIHGSDSENEFEQQNVRGGEREQADDFEDNEEVPQPPEPTPIYISTKTKIAYLNQFHVDIRKLFWEIPVLPYTLAKNGIVKKQMRFKSGVPSELAEIKKYVEEENKKGSYIQEYVITSIDNSTGEEEHFKDVRKISIGISKKDIMTYKSKQKSAFYNCFGMMLRIWIDNLFREFHVKFFNTGKIEIPGIQSDEYFRYILEEIIVLLQPYFEKEISFLRKDGSENASFETVLINSNFSCRFYINRNNLLNILKYKYHIQCNFDDNDYPGIRCKIYYDSNSSVPIEKQNVVISKKTKKISFMIFRTGSILISGKCEESVIHYVYDLLVGILKTEFKQIYLSGYEENMAILNANADKKKKKQRKRVFEMMNE
jgi:hypothetical protein